MTTHTKTLPALTLITALIGACTTMAPQSASSQPHILGLRQIDQKREYLNRYSCGDTTPLYCTCGSRMASATCHCGCPAR